jgi:hypothetical protein
MNGGLQKSEVMGYVEDQARDGSPQKAWPFTQKKAFRFKDQQ